jgi:uncharacterized membrane protein YhaH (DUF805 family)
MGFATAVGRCYARILTFSGRARRAEFWWFFLFQMLVAIGVQVALVMRVMDDPAFLAALSEPVLLEAWLERNPDLVQYAAIGSVAWLVLMALPNLTVTVRRLHDTDRSGWMIFMPTLVSIAAAVAGGALTGASAASGSAGGAAAGALIVGIVPLIASVWFLVILCQRGTQGPNRFGPDSVETHRRAEPSHPAFARPAQGEERNRAESARRAAARNYYQTRVLPSIHRPEQG